MTATRQSHPRFRRVGTAPRVELTDDDKAILECIYRHRFVRADDLFRLFENRSKDKLSRRLMLLYRGGFLDRPIAQIDRFRAGGSQALVYGLDSAGARFLKETASAPTGRTNWKARNRSFTRERLDHTLAISRFLIDLEVACRLRKGVSLLHADEVILSAPEVTRRLAHPLRWPVSVEFNGIRGEVHIIPDAMFGLRIARENAPAVRSYFFLEIDRGAMTIAPAKRVQESDAFLHRATILRKLVAYAESWRQNLHKQHFNIATARVLTLTTSENRAAFMRRVAEEVVVRRLNIPAGLFLFGIQKEEDPLAVDFQDGAGRTTRLLTEDAYRLNP